MKPETLAAIQKQFAKLLPVIEAISKHWSNQHYITIAVLIQNMAHDVSHCVGYKHEQQVEEMYRIQKILRLFADYYQSHVEKWISDEVDGIMMAERMSEDIPDEW